jgi:hypothetical protein
MRLNCRAAENLLLTDEVLASSGIIWSALEAKLSAWLINNKQHIFHRKVQEFVMAGLTERTTISRKFAIF